MDDLGSLLLGQGPLGLQSRGGGGGGVGRVLSCRTGLGGLLLSKRTLSL